MSVIDYLTSIRNTNSHAAWEDHAANFWVCETVSNILKDWKCKGEDVIISLKSKDEYNDKLFMMFQYWNVNTVWIFSQMKWFTDLTPDQLSEYSSLLEKDINDIIPVINKMHEVLGDIDLWDIMNYFSIFQLTDDELIPLLKTNAEEYRRHIDGKFRGDYICRYWVADELWKIWKDITIENIWKFNRGEFQEEAFHDWFLKEFNAFVESTWIQFSRKILAKLFEENWSWFDRRFGNGFAIFTRNIALYITTWLTDEIFEELPNDVIVSKLKNYKTDNPYFQWLLYQIISIFNASTSLWYQLYESWMNKRDKSCKDAETYFSFLISKNGWNCKVENFRIIGDFIEKNVDVEYQGFEEIWKSARTAISRKNLSVNWIFYPRWYLFRLNTKNDQVVSVEPLRMTILWWWDKIKDFWAITFWSQFKEFNALYDIKDWEDIISTLEDILINNV